MDEGKERLQVNKFKLITILVVMILCSRQAIAGTYSLDIDYKKIKIDGKKTKVIAINNTLPGPTLRFKEGEDVTIKVTNHLKEETSIHWHGLLVPASQDGVAGFSGYPGIKPNSTFTYHFKIKQSGTYWYHSHSGFQEQMGNYGSIIIEPKIKEPVRTDRDYVILVSDFTNEKGEKILNNLKSDSSYYNYGKRTITDFFSDIKNFGFKIAFRNIRDWGQMRMSPTDLSDVSGYKFLLNGKTPIENWTGIFKKGEKIRLRFINASSMSFYDVRILGLKMKVVSADGQNVEPVMVDEFRFAPAETYDVIVEPQDEKAYTIVLEPIDRTGFALGTLTPNKNLKGEMPIKRKRALLTMKDMNMETMMTDMPNMDMSNFSEIKSGWVETGIEKDKKTLNYSDLHYLGQQKDLRNPEREIIVTLDGNMERYIWTMNGKVYDGHDPINLHYGEKVRLKFINRTMMAHPMHLHGMFVQLENGQPLEKMPNKHTFIVQPGQSYSVLLNADAPGEWAFHCHLLYHMMSGMMNKIVVGEPLN